MQEFFQSLGTNEKAWGQPVSALPLGAYVAQKELQIVAIGGKDSMSGTFENLDGSSYARILCYRTGKDQSYYFSGIQTG